MEESFHKLRVTRMDLMQVHNLVDVATQLETLRQWKEEGRIRYLGITHYTAGAHDAMALLMASEPLDFIQINYSVGERRRNAASTAGQGTRRRGDCRPTCGRRPSEATKQVAS
jgi:diketogulonate reductase-like aldo/keto reductase